MTYPPLPPEPPVQLRVQRTLPDNVVPLQNGVTVWWSTIKREGEWLLPRKFRAFTCMGSAELNLMHARMGSGVSEIEIRCIFGNIEITVPPDVRVECEGEGLAASFEVVRVGEIAPLADDAPTLRITGNAYFSSVTINIVGKIGPGWRDKLKAWTKLNS